MSASQRKPKTLTPFQVSHHLARRLEGMGFEPYQSMKGRYLVLMEDAPGEIFDLGRPLKGSRFYAKNAIRKDRKVIADFEEFAKEDRLAKCYYWGIGLPCAKATCEGLEDALRSFNSKINSEFSVLRNQFGFEMLLLTLHLRYDRFSERFDLHAHFICRIEDDQALDQIKHHLRRKFSKYHFPLDPIESAGACATYMHARIFDNYEMLTWPDEALGAAWSVTQQRFRFSRVGGAFAEWRALQTAANDNPTVREDKQRIKENRRATADPRQIFRSTDKFLGKVMATVRGAKIYALLFENTTPVNGSEVGANSPPSRDSSSATGGVTQKPKIEARCVLRNVLGRCKALYATSRERITSSNGPARGNPKGVATTEKTSPLKFTHKIWNSFTNAVKTWLLRGGRNDTT